MQVSNHQATYSKKNKLTIIVFGAADPYLPDRVEFKQTSLLNLRQEMLFVFTDNSKDNIKTQL